MGGQFYGYVTGVANLSCQAEAQPKPSFRWLDAENRPVETGTIIIDEYKVRLICFIFIRVKISQTFTCYSCFSRCFFLHVNSFHGLSYTKMVFINLNSAPSRLFLSHWNINEIPALKPSYSLCVFRFVY